MSSGHASHKGVGTKPNTNANDIVDDASKREENAQDLLGSEGEATRVGEETADTSAATQRPENKPEPARAVE